MKRLVKIIFFATAAISFAACGGPANNAPASNANANSNASSNANAAKPVAAAPTVDTLLAMDKEANAAYIKGDSKFFETFLSDKFVIYDHGQRVDRAAAIKMIGGVKCAIKDGWTLSDPQMAKIDNDTYVVSYKSNMEGTCTMGGKTEKQPSPVRASSVWIRSGDKWMAAFHGENPIIDPKAPPPPPKKVEPKKADPKKEDKPAVNSDSIASVAKPKPDANTDALVKVHTSGWEAFKAKDAKKFDEITSANLSFVDAVGTWYGNKADVIKRWTETMKCEGITKVGVSDGFASALSPTVEVLTAKGTADGKCDGQKNGDLYSTAVYVKEGDAWKLAFMVESAAM